MLGGGEHVALAAAVPVGNAGQPTVGRRRRQPPVADHAQDDAQKHVGSATRTAALGVVTIAAVIRRMRHR
jgi:hypothetical protein